MKTVVKDGPYHWTGKMFLPQLSPASQYKARVSVENKLGWSEPGESWSFATLGAGTEQRCIIVQYSTVLNCTLHITMQYNTSQYITVLYSAVLEFQYI